MENVDILYVQTLNVFLSKSLFVTVKYENTDPVFYFIYTKKN